MKAIIDETGRKKAMRERKATVSEDGGSIEVYSEGKKYIIALGFSVWEWIEIIESGKNLPRPLAQVKPKEPGDGKSNCEASQDKPGNTPLHG